jgi:sarcosine oxidase subunit beta
MNYSAYACVIGGGVMGLTAAYYLTKAGKSVVLLEKSDIGSGASGSCDDMILLQSKKPGITLDLALESLELFKTLSQELGSDIGFKTMGGMVLIEDEKQLHAMEELVCRQVACGLKVEIIGKDALKKKQPHVADSIIASTFSASDSQVDPLRLMRRLLSKSLGRGLTVLRQTVPLSIQKKGYWQIELPGGVLESETVLIAAGAWSAEVGNLAGVSLPVEPRRGQLAITERVPATGETNVWTAAYIASKLDKSLMPNKGEYAKQIGLGFSYTRSADGNYLIGSTRENAGFDKSTSQRAISMIVKQAKTYFPLLTNVSVIRTMAGFRPATPDGDSIVGAVDGHDGLFVATGHEGDGIALSPVTGKAVAEMICGRFHDSRYEQLNLRRFSKMENTKKTSSPDGR